MRAKRRSRSTILASSIVRTGFQIQGLPTYWAVHLRIRWHHTKRYSADHCYAIAPCCTVVNAMGGAVSSAGSITLTNSYVSHCLAISRFGGYAAGGALSGYGPVTLTNTDIAYTRAYAVSGNAMGGAIMDGHHLPAEGKVTLSNSAISLTPMRMHSLSAKPGVEGFLPPGRTDG